LFQRSFIVSINAKHVFLVSGQRMTKGEDGGEKLAPEVEQCVVIAENGQQAYQKLEGVEPKFRPLGCATLDDYESTAAKLRAALAGDVPVGWKLIAHQGAAA
jgi:hypothetical protein